MNEVVWGGKEGGEETHGGKTRERKGKVHKRKGKGMYGRMGIDSEQKVARKREIYMLKPRSIECRMALFKRASSIKTIRDKDPTQCSKVNEGEPAYALSVSACVGYIVRSPCRRHHSHCTSQLRPPHLPISHLGPLPQCLPLDLSRRTLGHLVHKDHTASQVFMLCDFGLDPLFYLLLARRSLGIELDVGSRMFLGAEGVLHADDATISNGGMGEEDGFELGRSHLEAGHFDKFLFGKNDQR